ncbi:Acetoacetate metabolism regulatory protein AtoC [Candidatus Nitrospira nitrosa]|uniref:Acetoacetate metabolism regulatory protein AtoC n=1 Tax=Candidatus Nitrospira nitrosa TaxID=1742972 RepID=A0A0S4LAJ2_9BACT|nr:sigma-54 dependent transcriptional regulator [Candidatus Nitrospira nitrosa]CUS34533.1 Acetoacetate metabolism regulatory protein AtoC [Candidatus Nitrospira nitrosa]
MEKILVVDDEQSLREVLSIMLKRAGYAVTIAMDGEDAVELLQKEIFDLVITDLRMPKVDGMEVLKAVKSASPETVVLIITAFASADSAVEAMKQGAYDYLTKPFQVDEVQLIIRNALEKRRLTTENMLLKREMASQSSFAQLVGQSEAIQRVFEVVRKVADSKSNVLICGESGTGKELVARAIHYNSARSALPFVAVNCSAVPETLLESELFGHMKGSFTGAIANKAGLFEIANGGTIFLDEIGDTTPTIQVKLLRVIQEREFRRVGGSQDIKVDVRIVAATNKDLEKAVADGSFREDLYYRLDVIPIRLPPLRMRTGDIPLLVNHFLERFAKESGKPKPVFSSDAMHVLLEHEWRGNVRELENLIERVVAFSVDGPVTEADVRGWLHRPTAPPPVQGMPLDLTDEGVDLEGLINGIEKDLLLKALERSKWVKKKAARMLRLNTRSFRYRLEKYAIKGGRD